MTAIDDVVANNGDYSPANSSSDARPKLGLAVVACMDARLHVEDALGIGEGDAHVIRTAGGTVTDDVLRSLLISQRRLGTREVMLIHHTRCGMEGLDTDALHDEIAADLGERASLHFHEFDDVDEALRQSLRRVRECGLLPHRDRVRGFVYDVDSGRLREVTA